MRTDQIRPVDPAFFIFQNLVIFVWMAVQIKSFRSKYQSQVDQLLGNINAEFETSMFSPVSMKMKDAARMMKTRFWVAMDNNSLVGTIGVIRLKNKKAVIKSMFVQKEYRGNQVAVHLLEKAFSYSRNKRCDEIFLGTMSQMKAAQKFYEKHGFIRTDPSVLPSHFPFSPVDDVYYKKELK